MNNISWREKIVIRILILIAKIITPTGNTYGLE